MKPSQPSYLLTPHFATNSVGRFDGSKGQLFGFREQRWRLHVQPPPHLCIHLNPFKRAIQDCDAFRVERSRRFPSCEVPYGTKRILQRVGVWNGNRHIEITLARKYAGTK